MKKITLATIFTILLLPSLLLAQTTDNQALIKDLNEKITQIKLDIAKYKTTGITNAEKLRLVSRINEVKTQTSSLKQKITQVETSQTTNTVTSEIKPTVTLLSPTAGTVWYKGTSYSIKIKTTDMPNIGLVLYRSNGEYGDTINRSVNITPDVSNLYSYTVPSTVYDGDYYIVAYDTRNSARSTKSPVFKIMPKPVFEVVPNVSSSPSPSSAPVATLIQITEPNGGEKWQLGKTYSIKWNANKSGVNATINLKNINTNQIVKMYPFTNMQTSNSYSISIPIDLLGGSHKVEIVTSDGVKDESDNTFLIINPAPVISGISPTTLYPGTVVKMTGKFTANNNLIYWINPTTGYPLTPTTQSETTLTFTVPSWAKGPYDLKVENEDFTLSEIFKVNVNTPTASVSPSPVSYGDTQTQRASLFDLINTFIETFLPW
jgi:hypothetical protein